MVRLQKPSLGRWPFTSLGQRRMFSLLGVNHFSEAGAPPLTLLFSYTLYHFISCLLYGLVPHIMPYSKIFNLCPSWHLSLYHQTYKSYSKLGVLGNGYTNNSKHSFPLTAPNSSATVFPCSTSGLEIYVYMLATFWCYFSAYQLLLKIAIHSSLLKVMETFHDKSSSATLNILGFLTIHCTSHFPLVLHVWFPWLFVLIPPKSISLVLVSFYTLINYGGSQRAFVYDGYICGYVPY